MAEKDIVERLRISVNATMHEAADEIERLRAALTRIAHAPIKTQEERGLNNIITWHYHYPDDTSEIALAALNGGDDYDYRTAPENQPENLR